MSNGTGSGGAYPKFDRLVDAGVIPNAGAYNDQERDKIEQTLSDADVDTLVRIKLNLGPDFAHKDLGGGAGQLIIF